MTGFVRLGALLPPISPSTGSAKDEMHFTEDFGDHTSTGFVVTLDGARWLDGGEASIPDLCS